MKIRSFALIFRSLYLLLGAAIVFTSPGAKKPATPLAVLDPYGHNVIFVSYTLHYPVHFR
jgi:hypothetical protein